MRRIDAFLRGGDVIGNSYKIDGMAVRVINDAAGPVVAVAGLAD
jgi:hypothetical protein